jgi:alpha-galactosidase/6-phospho-beta-glucosidase family protein
MFQVIAEDIRAFCPDAFVINYTNPMAMCIRVLYDTFPEIKAVGCCHEVFHTQSLLCKALAELEGIENVTRQQLETTVAGVNHLRSSPGRVTATLIYSLYIGPSAKSMPRTAMRKAATITG